MSPSRAAGGASALYGAGLIITSEARATSRSSATVMGRSPSGRRCGTGSEVGVAEGGFTVVVEGADAFDAVGVDRGAQVRVHHDRDRLLDRLALAQVHRALHGLYGGRGVVGDLVRDLPGRGQKLAGIMELVDHAEPVRL